MGSFIVFRDQHKRICIHTYIYTLSNILKYSLAITWSLFFKFQRNLVKGTTKREKKTNLTFATGVNLKNQKPSHNARQKTRARERSFGVDWGCEGVWRTRLRGVSDSRFVRGKKCTTGCTMYLCI